MIGDIGGMVKKTYAIIILVDGQVLKVNPEDIKVVLEENIAFPNADELIKNYENTYNVKILPTNDTFRPGIKMIDNKSKLQVLRDNNSNTIVELKYLLEEMLTQLNCNIDVMRPGGVIL